MAISRIYIDMNICLVEAPILNTNSLQTGQGFLDVPVSQFRHVSSLSTRSPPRPPWYVLTSHNEAKCSVMHHAWTCFVPGPPFLGRRCWPATSRFVDNTGCIHEWMMHALCAWCLAETWCLDEYCISSFLHFHVHCTVEAVQTIHTKLTKPEHFKMKRWTFYHCITIII